MAMFSQLVGNMAGRCGVSLVGVLRGDLVLNILLIKTSEQAEIEQRRQIFTPPPRFQDAFMYGIRELVGHFQPNVLEREANIDLSFGHQEISSCSSWPKGLQTVLHFFALHTCAN